MTRNLGEEIPLDRPYQEAKPKSPARLTDVEWQKSPEKSQNSLQDHMTDPEPLYRAIRITLNSH